MIQRRTGLRVVRHHYFVGATFTLMLGLVLGLVLVLVRVFSNGRRLGRMLLPVLTSCCHALLLTALTAAAAATVVAAAAVATMATVEFNDRGG